MPARPLFLRDLDRSLPIGTRSATAVIVKNTSHVLSNLRVDPRRGNGYNAIRQCTKLEKPYITVT
jgi:hypothetical protein